MNWNADPPESAFQNAKRAHRKARILNCPSAAPFLPTLVRAVLCGEIGNANPRNPENLLDLTIYLPSRGAVEPLKLAFLSASPNGASFLPRIRVLGQVDPIDLFATFGAKIPGGSEIAMDLLRRAVHVPQAFDELERRLQLTAHVLKAAEGLQSTNISPDERLFVDLAPSNAFAIAGRLTQLIDEIQSEGVDLGRLQFLEAGDVSSNEQLALQLLRAVIKNWKAHKSKIGKIDPEERVNVLMGLEAEFIKRTKTPVIVAGSTASIAATLNLMEAVLAQKDNAVILSGLDRHLDEESWACIAGCPEHPQHALQRLLNQLGISRDEVGELAHSDTQWSEDRASFLSEALRPAATTKEWRRFIAERKRPSDPDQKLTIIEAENIPEEADIVSLILRESLEKAEQTAALVTRDEKLAQRVRNNLARWNIGVEDDANARTARRFPGQIAACAASGKAEDLIALLKHAPGDVSAPFRRFAEIIDLGALRQMWKPSRFEHIPAALSRAAFAVASGDSRHPAMKRIGADQWEEARFFAERIVEAFSPLSQIATQQRSLSDWIEHHGDVLSRLAKLGIGVVSSEKASDTLLSELKRFALPRFFLDLSGYAALFDEVLNAQPISRLPDPHPRLFFCRPLDARLLSADLIVLAGMNEGCWPQSLDPDPWLNRKERAVLGLSPRERRIGQAAQDFASLAAGAAQVYITRSRTLNGSLARPSRWISRMKVLARGAPHLSLLDDGTKLASIARLLRETAKVEPAKRPEPRPPLAARPRRLSVTAIETWFANPYAIYARHILRLEPLRGPEEGCDARDKGILIHAALHNFLEKHKISLPPNMAERLVDELDQTAYSLGFDLARAPFWRPRFERFAHWFSDTEKTLREGLLTLKSEVSGKLTLTAPAGPFEVTARADRIDIRDDGSLRILDFKTSVNTAQQSLARNAPQLALEGLLAREGAFAGVASAQNIELAYITATGGEPAGEIKPLKAPAGEAIESAHIGALNLIARFDDPATSYQYSARAIFKDKTRYDPYSHLARVQEWAGEQAIEGENDE